MSELTAVVQARSTAPTLTTFALEEGLAEAYDEEAFLYFLEIERKRSEASNRPFLLMLVDFKRFSGLDASIDPVAARQLFSALTLCLRETDFVGWYREGRVVGAVLTQHGEPEGDEISEVVRRRVGTRLERQLPADLFGNLQLRVYQLSPNANSRGNQ
jgi:hypothetical protein